MMNSVATITPDVLPPLLEKAQLRWFAVYTRSRHEKRVAEQLERKQLGCYLPLYEAAHRWKDRTALVQLPLFPGYVFVRLAAEERLKVLEVPGVVRFVGFGGQAHPLPEEQMDALRNGLTSRLRMEPHPFLKTGRRVRITRGPLLGAEGILLRRKDQLRFILSVELLMRSVSIEVDTVDLELV